MKDGPAATVLQMPNLPVWVVVQGRVVAQRCTLRHGQQRWQVPRLLHKMPCSICDFTLWRVGRTCTDEARHPSKLHGVLPKCKAGNALLTQ